MDLWPLTIDARRSLLATYEDLDDDDWSTPSLCDDWTVREVLAHLILAARPPLRRYAAEGIRARGDFDAVNRTLASHDARRCATDELIDEYRIALEHRFSPPGWPAAAPFSDIVLHSLDVRIPLGLPDERPAAHYEPVMALLHSRMGRSFTGERRPDVRWVATDHPWTLGEGPEVHGAMVDLVVAAAGRSPRIDRLHGDGVASVAAWLNAN